MGVQEFRDWLSDLELREKLQENQSVLAVVLILVIVLCLSLVMCQLFGGGSGSYSNEVKLVYFDTANKTVRVIDHEYPDMPASPLAGTDNTFLASVYACDDCPKGKIKDGMTLAELEAEGMFVAWLERIDPNATPEMAMFGSDRTYRRVTDQRWYRSDEQGYAQMNKELQARCARSVYCIP